jgi:dipeptidyl aminopeptidase/acylaminoacyl peptidase
VIYKHQTSIPSIAVHAVSSDQKTLLFIDENDDREAIYSMNLADGEIIGPIFSKENTDIEFLETDINRRLTAVVYSGFKTQYEFVNKSYNVLYDRLSATFPMSNVYYESSTADRKKIVVRVSGADAAGDYMLFDTEKVMLTKLNSEYNVESINQLKAIKYKARDGLSIPAIITFPPEHHGREKLPLIALPHGGPEAYDNLQFDWLAQYLATKGYIVLQPNFRGSTGFGYQFRNAGRGRWGKEMQDDVTDGVNSSATVPE